MNTDVSEAILLGFYVVNDKLEWSCNDPRSTEQSLSISDRECSSLLPNIDISTPIKKEEKDTFSVPLIHRYTNGNVILPLQKKK